LKHVELIETSTFTRQITALLSNEDYGAFQSRLAANPGLGALIKGGSGIRRIRVGFGSRGKCGGARIIYWLESVREGGAILRGQRKASGRFEVGFPGYGRFANRTGSYAVEDHRVRSTAGGEGYL
jgi:hypothetical protein